ncbi:hypothetical protein MO973_23090 [Paenibacillus sp. TRM 82003]|nr:hypothetical protein [Paenibacillus sp. TRM 82003]
MDDPNRTTPYDPHYGIPPRRKRKWAAGLLSFLFPGLGHMYAGAMLRGLFFMLLLIGLIFGVVLVAMEGVVPLIVLLSVMIPVVYFYALFDALQTTERWNDARAYRFPPPPYGPAPAHSPEAGVAGPASGRSIGAGQVALLLVAFGVCIGFFLVQPDWLEDLRDGSGALVGAMILVGAGVVLLLSGAGKKR